MTSIFFSYSHKDEELRDQLEVHLSALKRSGLIDTWHDRIILAGDEFGDEISENLEAADIILLLVSADFIASDYCYAVEMRRALERHDAGEARVIPVILRPCDWHDTPFGKLQAAPKDGKAVRSWPDLDEAFLDIVRAIKAALPNRKDESDRTVGRTAVDDLMPVPTALGRPASRSSNLRIKKEFSDADRDQFLYEAFNFMKRFFETSLGELSVRYKDIRTNYREIDANRFNSIIYKNGTKVSECSVFLGGMFRQGIAYSMTAGSSSNTYNEDLSVDADNHSLYLKSMGMHFGNRHEAKLTFEGAAEFYWSILMKPLQE